MGAYQCLQCGALEEFDENMQSKDCCGNQELFRVNDMPGEILKLRAALAQQQGRDAEADSDRLRLNHMQLSGSTVEVIPSLGGNVFCIGGKHKTNSRDIRLAIDAAIAASTKEQAK